MVIANAVFEGGDIIEYDNEYYEVDSVGASNYWGGKNPSTLLGMTEGELQTYDANGKLINDAGYSVAVVCEAHVTSIARLNLKEIRFGQNRPPQNSANR